MKKLMIITMLLSFTHIGFADLDLDCINQKAFEKTNKAFQDMVQSGLDAAQRTIAYSQEVIKAGLDLAQKGITYTLPLAQTTMDTCQALNTTDTKELKYLSERLEVMSFKGFVMTGLCTLCTLELSKSSVAPAQLKSLVRAKFISRFLTGCYAVEFPVSFYSAGFASNKSNLILAQQEELRKKQYCPCFAGLLTAIGISGK